MDLVDSLECLACRTAYPVIAGILDLRIFPDPYISLEADRGKALELDLQIESTDFSSLINYYYTHTQVVPPQHAFLYTRGLLSAEDRSSTVLNGWRAQARQVGTPGGSLLDIGCGTAPLMLAASKHYERVIGVDVALRWLVLGKKRLQEAGLTLPLICANAEALPFTESSLDCVASESTLEHLGNQYDALLEMYRVLKDEGSFFATTPNRWSIGPDPQTGIPAGGYLPDSATAWLVKRQGGIPPKRRLLSRSDCFAKLSSVGFSEIRIELPEISASQRARFSRIMQRVIDFYMGFRNMSVGRRIFLQIGPLFSIVAKKRNTAGNPQSSPG
jgi:SAM-dependent methyltransferase